MKKVKLLHPSYYNKFSCAGSACELTCCRDWVVNIDKSTYMLYRNVRDPEFSETMQKAVKRNKSADATDRSYARFLLDDKNLCHYFKDGLCTIQAKYGHNYLSLTCQNYPRETGIFHADTLEIAMSTTCPEVVRVALFPNEPITFEVNEFDVDKVAAILKLPRKSLKLDGAGSGLIPHAQIIRKACIDILQCRNMSMRDRLFAVGMMLGKLTEAQESAKTDDAPNIAASYVRLAKTGQFAGVLDTFADNSEMRIEMQSYLLQYAISMCENQGEKYKPFKIFMTSIANLAHENNHSTLDTDKLFALINKSTDKYWHEFLEKYEHVLENYFVNIVFLRFYPFAYNQLNPYQHFIILAEQYALFRLLLCVCAEEHGAITEELIILVVASMSLNMLHNNTAKAIAEVYQKTGNDTLAHISYLIR